MSLQPQSKKHDAIKHFNNKMSDARRRIASGKLNAAGYRLKVLPIAAQKGLDGVALAEYPTLAEAGFEAKTENQKERESKGAEHGIVEHCGPEVYNNPAIAKKGPWVKEGDVILFQKYAGKLSESPPGSDIWWRFMNDEDVLGVYPDE